MGNKLFRNQGLTLIELVITIALLGIIVSFMFVFFQFNYSTFFRSRNQYDLQTSLINVNRLIEEELRFTQNIRLDTSNKIEYNSPNEGTIYLEDNIIKMKDNDGVQDLTDIDLVIITSLDFKLNKNLLTIRIKAKSLDEKKEFTMESTIELLNINGEGEGINFEPKSIST